MEIYKSHSRFYHRTLSRIEQNYITPKDTCFVFVQHSFLPSLNFFESIENKIGAIIPKRSSAKSNPEIVSLLKNRFPGKVHDQVTRSTLQNNDYAVDFLKNVTTGRPFAILEYGGYFAPAAQAISNDAVLRKTLKGFVEGTENGIRGSDDNNTIGYQEIAARLNHPVVSKSRSRIKSIMDIEIGPAIVQATDTIIRRNLGCSLRHLRGNIGVIGLGGIGLGILTSLNKDHIKPLIFDTDLAVMASLANLQNYIVSQHQILSSCEILFLNTGSCFLSSAPALLNTIKDNVILVLCTSGDVEGGIPQLISNGLITLINAESNNDIAVYSTVAGKKLRIALGSDGVGQAPNMSLKDGSASPANLMSDMEFCAIGDYLACADTQLEPGRIHSPPKAVEDIILAEWLREFYPQSIATKTPPDDSHGKLSGIDTAPAPLTGTPTDARRPGGKSTGTRDKSNKNTNPVC